MRLLTTIFFALAVTTACGADGPAETEPPDSTTTTMATTSTTAPAETSTTSTTDAPTTTSTTTPTTTAPSAGVDMARCDSPEGYTIHYPESWHTNPGDVVPTCGWFHPEPFEVPGATDERVAAISVYVDPVPFAEVAAPDADRQADRAVTAIDGRQAVRLEYEAGADSLWPQGTPITLYAIDVSTESRQQTLLIDTVGLTPFDYQTNRTVLDQMAPTIDIEMEGVADAPAVVASYQGGGSAFTVEGRVSGSEACLRIPPEGEEICTGLPASDQLHTIQLEELEPVLAGVTGSDVFAVTAELRDGSQSSVLPAAIPDSDVGGFSFTVGLDAIERFVLTDIGGEELRIIEPGG